MDIIKNTSYYLFGIYLVLGISSFFLSCSTHGKFNLPNSSPETIKAYKNVIVYSRWPYLKNTGLIVEKGDLFSLIVTGKIRTYPKKYPKRWDEAHQRMRVVIGNKLHNWSPFNGTMIAKYEGEISFYIKDGDFDVVNGKAYQPEWYKDNSGKYEVTIIVWKNKDCDQIIDFFNDMASLNPDNDAIIENYEQAKAFKDYYYARMEAEKELEETKNKLGKLKQKTDTDDHIDETTISDKDIQIANLEAKLQKLMETLSQLDNIKEQLEAEKEKSARLAQELESQLLQTEGPEDDRSPPLLLVVSPKDGFITTAAAVKLSGVAEDNKGIEKFEIYLNDKKLSETRTRGLNISHRAPLKRHEFDEKLFIKKGKNKIRIRVVDTGGQITETMFAVYRKERNIDIWAVVVGIDKYNRIPELKYAVNDAKAVYQLLTTNNQIPERNITLLTNEKATLINLRSSLGTRLKQNAGKDDMVIIYFAGHGATERDVSSPDGDGLEKYILPYDADPKDLYASALPMREIAHILNRIQSDRLVFIADACYSGASGGRTINIEGIRANISDGYLNRISRGKGRVIITASGPNEVSAEDNNLQHGVFTHYLIEGLKGPADYDEDGMITVDEVYRYVSDAVPKATRQEQHPVKMGTVEGQLVLSIVN